MFDRAGQRREGRAGYDHRAGAAIEVVCRNKSVVEAIDACYTYHILRLGEYKVSALLCGG